SRPDVMLLIYPVITMGEFAHGGSRRNLLGDNPSADLVDLMSNEKQVTRDTPPAFLVHTENDMTVPVENSIQFAAAMRPAGASGGTCSRRDRRTATDSRSAIRLSACGHGSRKSG